MQKNSTKNEIDNFLDLLDRNREKAGEKYLNLRFKLENFFDWRKCENSEELTDIVFDRLTKKINEGEKIENFEAYSVSIAKFVYLENSRKIVRSEELNENLQNLNSEDSFEKKELKEKKFDCLNKCLAKLPEEKRRLLIDYYDTEEATMISKRKRLAQKLGLNLNSFRIRISRLKSKLEKCTKICCDDRSE